MRILLVGAGAVGDAIAKIAAQRDFFEAIIVSDYDESRAERTIAWIETRNGPQNGRFVSAQIDASDPDSVASVALEHGATHVMNAVEPKFVPTIFAGALAAGANYLDMAMSHSGPHPTESYAEISIWTTLEECLNPPVIWEKNWGWYTTEPFSDPEIFHFPEGIGPLGCVNVEHEEVLLMPRWIDAQRVTFKRGLGSEFIGVVKTLHQLELDKVEPVHVESSDGPVKVAPRDVVAAGLPDPSTLGPRMTGKTGAGVWVTGIGAAGKPRQIYLYHVCDNEWTMAEYECQCVVWQTALSSVIALELLATGAWFGIGVVGPEAFDAQPFLELMATPRADGGYGQPWGQREMEPAE